MENPSKMDDDYGVSPFMETAIWVWGCDGNLHPRFSYIKCINYSWMIDMRSLISVWPVINQQIPMVRVPTCAFHLHVFDGQSIFVKSLVPEFMSNCLQLHHVLLLPSQHHRLSLVSCLLYPSGYPIWEFPKIGLLPLVGIHWKRWDFPWHKPSSYWGIPHDELETSLASFIALFYPH